MGDDRFEPEVSVNVNAIRSCGYDDGYADGLRDGKSLGRVDGYKAGISDLIGRLKNAEHFTNADHGHCLAIVDEIAGSMIGCT